MEICPGDRDDDISCKLFTANLVDKPSYLGLSYVWGDPTTKRLIECNGAALHITENLAAAMIQLRSRYCGKIFWIDAISINQKNLKERAEQVQLMCDIYGSAENVVIYLGEESPGLGAAMGLLDELHELALKYSTSPANPSQLRGYLPKPYDQAWYRLHDLFNRPWFSRIWVVQEIALSSGDADVICGQYSLRWSRMARVALTMYQAALASSTTGSSSYSNIAKMESCKTYGYQFLSLLQSTRLFASTDPRDMLFALYGIVRPQERFILNSSHFLVSYELPVKEVYRNAVIGYIKHFASVEIVCEAGGQGESKIEDLPSWVPDWSIKRKWRHNSFAYGAAHSGHDACASQPALISTTENPNVLRLAGKYHDAVAWVAQPFEEGELSLLPHRRRPGTLERLWNDVADRLGNTRQTAESFWRTLIANVDGNARSISPDCYRHFLRYWHDSKVHDERASRYLVSNSRKTGPIEEDEDKDLFAKAAKDVETEITVEEFEALKRFAERMARQFPCKSRQELPQSESISENKVSEPHQRQPAIEDQCPHCAVVAVPDTMLKNGTLVVTGYSPARAFRDTDPFIADYYENIGDSDSLMMADGNTHYHARLASCLPIHSFFTTKGGLMGLGPRNAQVGDSVIVMSGSRIPFLLRSTRLGQVLLDETVNKLRLIWQYQVIGDCYVHGIMNGEAVKDMDWANDYEVYDLV